MLDYMNSNAEKPAIVRYGDNDFQVVQRGNYVPCAVTGSAILLRELHYWSVDRQEAYIDANASLKAELAARI